MVELLQLWGGVEVLGILCLPLTLTVFQNLPDRGWALSKVLGLSIFAFMVWFPLMCIPFLVFNQALIVGILLICIGASGLAYLSGRRHFILQTLRRQCLYIVTTELLFTMMVFLMGILRSMLPDIHGFEMFMDEGFVASIVRATHFPPPDMWYAGQSINYYYYAHFILALLAKVLGYSPAVAVNTGICLLFGLVAVGLFSVTCNIVAWARYLRRQRNASMSLAHHDEEADHIPLMGATPYGFFSVLVGLIFGNLAATQQWWQQHSNAVNFNWYTPTRVIAATINEFPAFSFLLSCFHAHVMALAFTILSIALALNLFLAPEAKGFAAFGKGWHSLVSLVTIAIVLGSLYAMNGWDFPTYLGLVLVCIMLQQFWAHQMSFSWLLVRNIVLVGGSLATLSFVLYIPFYLNFVSPSEGIGLVPIRYHSSLRDELLIYGLFVFLFLTLILVGTLKRPFVVQKSIIVVKGAIHTPEHAQAEEESAVSQGRIVPYSSGAMHMHEGGQDSVVEEASSVITKVAPTELELKREGQVPGYQGKRRSWRLAGTLVLTFFLVLSVSLMFLLPADETLVATLSIAILGVILLFYHHNDRSLAFLFLLGASAFTLIAGTEVFFLKDVLAGGDYLRMNTIFKFYFQAWALLSICSGAGLFFIIESLFLRKAEVKMWMWIQQGLAVCWGGCLLILVAASMVYPILAPVARYTHTDTLHSQPYIAPSFSLDGMAYLRNCQPPVCDYSTAPDYDAIRWLNKHVEGSPAIVEAVGDDYHFTQLVSTFTGLPTLIGWGGHEYQWRYNWISMPHTDHAADFSRRKNDVDTIYTNPDDDWVQTLLHYYHTKYLYVGSFEHQRYRYADLQRFARFMDVIYQRNGVTIYAVRS